MRSLARRAGERERRLLVAADRARLDARALRDLPGELGAVVGVARRARQDRRGVRDAVLVDQCSVALERVEDPLHGFVGQPSRGVDALAKARHDRLAMQLRERAIGRHVGDQQPRGVGPDVDDRNPHSGEIIDRGALEAVS